MDIATYIKYVTLSLIWCLYTLGITLIGQLALQIISKLLAKQNIITKTNNIFLDTLVYLGVGIGTIGLISLIFYSFHGSSAIYSLIILLLLIISTIHFIYYSIKKYTKYPAIINFKIPKKLALLTAILSLLLVIFIAFDFVYSAWHGTYIAGDQFIHFTRIFNITTFGFNINDGYLKGVLETRYSFNFIYSFFVPVMYLSKLLNVSFLATGFAAYFNFRIIQMLAIGSITYYIADKISVIKSFEKYLLSFLALFVVFSTQTLFCPNYPSVISLAWFTLLAIGIMELLSGKNRKYGTMILVLSSILLAGTHPTYALIGGLFLFMTVLSYLVVGRVFLKQKLCQNTELLLVALLCILMAIPSFVAFTLPNNMQGAAISVGTDVANFKIFNITVIHPLFNLFIIRKGYSPLFALTSLIGLMFVLRKFWSKNYLHLSTAILMLLVFAVIITSNPVVMMLAKEAGVPYWVLLRFSSINILMIYGALSVFGIYAIYSLILRKMQNTRTTKIISVLLMITIVIVFLISKGVNTYRQNYLIGQNNIAAIQFNLLHLNQAVLSNLPSNQHITVLATEDLSIHLPLLNPYIQVISINPNHMPPGADGANRQQCQENLLNNISDADSVRALHINYVLVENDSITKKQLQASDTKDYTEIYQGKDYSIYKVMQGRENQTVLSCKEYQISEKTLR